MKSIQLTDGSKLFVEVNMLTIKLISDCKLSVLLSRIDKLQKNENKNLDKIQDLEMKALSKIIWCILRSNGRKVDEEDALRLMPTDTEQIELMFNEFQNQVLDFKKKQVHKKQTLMK